MPSSTHILLTGASGYIGGAVLHELLHSELGRSPSTTFTVLIRSSPANEAAIAKLRQHSNVHVELGDHHDAQLVIRLVHTADVVVHTADSADDMPSANAIIAGLTSTEGEQKRRFYVHTSGTGVLTFGNADARGEYATPDSEVWTDLDFTRYNSIPPQAPHRDVDMVVINAAQQHAGKYDCVIVAPPTIYGQGTGPGNQLSQQIPTVIRLTLATGHPGRIGNGKNLWNSVHITDLAQLYHHIVLAGLARSIPCIAGGGGLYFAATGEFQWGDVQRAVGEELLKRGLVKGDVKEWTKEEAEKHAGPSVWMAIGSNSRCRSERADKERLGWQPKHHHAVLSTIPYDTDQVLKRRA